MRQESARHIRQETRFRHGNIAGAFADGAILFPLMAALAVRAGMNGAVLMVGAGLAYIFSGLFFRVPMPVQPLKALVVGALALGASAEEVRAAGLGVGLFCLALSMLPVNRVKKYIPQHIIHGIQFSLGVLLLLKGAEWAWGGGSMAALIAVWVFVPVAILVQARMTVPVLGIIAVLGVISGVWLGGHAAVAAVPPEYGPRFGIIAALLLPQLALTLTNSVIGTYDTAHRYFGAAASRVTLKNLLLSIGFGNIVMSLIGSLPFCHGSGGLTAHVKAGARSYAMNFYIGVFLIVLAAISFVSRVDLIPQYPALLMAAIVGITGWYHVRLADDSWAVAELRLIVVAMGGIVLVTQNMLYGLLAGVVLEALRRRQWLGMRR